MVGSNITWTSAGVFGPGQVQYYRYAWDQSPTHTFADTETQWSAGPLATTPTAAGTWYLHVKGYNGVDVGNGTYDYAVTATQPATLQLLSIINSNGIVSLTWNSVSGSVYRVEYTPDLGADTWSNLVPDVQATDTTASTTDDTGGAGQRFYRVLMLP
jgi:hypothetical protein